MTINLGRTPGVQIDKAIKPAFIAIRAMRLMLDR